MHVPYINNESLKYMRHLGVIWGFCNKLTQKHVTFNLETAPHPQKSKGEMYHQSYQIKRL
jgi:hypothetical protein